MILFLVFLAAALWVARQTRPDPKLFEQKQQNGPFKKIGIFSRLVRAVTGPTNCIIIKDLHGFAWLASVKKTGCTDSSFFLGAYGLWIPIDFFFEYFNSEYKIISPDRETEFNNSIENENLKLAIMLKAQGKFEEASLEFEKLARSSKNLDYRAKNLEEAGRALQMLSTSEFSSRGHTLIREAAEIYKGINRINRSALLYEGLAKDHRTQPIQAISYLSCVSQLRRLDGQSTLTIDKDIGNLHAELGDFTSASKLFCNLLDHHLNSRNFSGSDAILSKYEIDRLLLLIIMCKALIGDHVSLIRWFNDFEAKIPKNKQISREHEWVTSFIHLQSTSDASLVEQVDKKLSMIASPPNWFLRAWISIKDSQNSSNIDLC